MCCHGVVMTEISDFGFVLNYALYNELPMYVTGYIDQPCNEYVPPQGYVIVSCDYAGNMVIGGSSRTSLSKIRLGREDVAGTQNLLIIGGIALVVLIGIGTLFVSSRSKGNRKIVARLDSSPGDSRLR